MPGGGDGDKAAWVLRVLGIGTTAPAGPDPQALMALWRDARDTVDGQVGRLQAAFKATDHPLGARIADRGLVALSGGLLAGMQIALFDYAATARTGAPPSALLQAIHRLLGFLQQHPALPVLERNPFQVQVTIRRTLGSALHEMLDLLQPE